MFTKETYKDVHRSIMPKNKKKKKEITQMFINKLCHLDMRYCTTNYKIKLLLHITTWMYLVDEISKRSDPKDYIPEWGGVWGCDLLKEGIRKPVGDCKWFIY